jgi:hypothetical protein
MKKFIITICTSLFLFTACNKDTTGAEVSLAYQMVADKIWYLDYNQTITSTGTTTKTYIGQSTYFVKFLKNLTTVDSDGISGTYTIEKVNGKLQIHVFAKTAGANALEYNYSIETLGANNMILFYTNSGSTVKFFYNTSH